MEHDIELWLYELISNENAREHVPTVGGGCKGFRLLSREGARSVP
jgi:hypothetical protein